MDIENIIQGMLRVIGQFEEKTKSLATKEDVGFLKGQLESLATKEDVANVSIKCGSMMENHIVEFHTNKNSVNPLAIIGGKKLSTTTYIIMILGLTAFIILRLKGII